MPASLWSSGDMYKTHHPLENTTRSSWYARRYNFSHGIIYKYCYCWMKSYQIHPPRPAYIPTGHSTGQCVDAESTSLSQRHWRWFNVDTTPCALWDKDTRKCRLIIEPLFGELAYVAPILGNYDRDLMLFVVSRMLLRFPKLFIWIHPY